MCFYQEGMKVWRFRARVSQASGGCVLCSVVAQVIKVLGCWLEGWGSSPNKSKLLLLGSWARSITFHLLHAPAAPMPWSQLLKLVYANKAFFFFKTFIFCYYSQLLQNNWLIYLILRHKLPIRCLWKSKKRRKDKNVKCSIWWYDWHLKLFLVSIRIEKLY